jgi:hypothetical protein
METYRDPEECFAPLEMIERLLQFRSHSGFSQVLYLKRADELADILDAYGFDCYAYSAYSDGRDPGLSYGEYTSPVVPGGDAVRSISTNH